uniref:Nucleotidyltransferase domain-containing protein n=1 Tax=Candidatus Kentrum sp. TC TaxID=2126339 RepID=A0A450ZPD0_9GAMM|nr:MAG: Nucleotidyltransferase domain-containing protein [Candidatus Kentron sp. TC]VFK55571.1 MAG: Nucleotidyltransferase domain-containing protein [Candidatus Kentron sp. TC]
MKEVGLSHREIRMIRAVLRRVPTVREAMLFGSRAKLTHRPESDVDLALVGIDDSLTVQAIAEALESLPTPYRFDFTSLTRETYAPLVRHIERVGVTIYARSAHVSQKDEEFDALAAAESKELGYGSE